MHPYISSLSTTQKHAVKRLTTSKLNFCNLPLPAPIILTRHKFLSGDHFDVCNFVCFLMYLNIIFTTSPMFSLNFSMVT